MKKSIFIILLVLLAGLFAYHFIAANQAEAEIDRAIQAEADSSATRFSVQYSSIDVSPFSGDIEFADVTLIQGSNIERADRVHIDLSYADFLSIYFSGVKEGLDRLGDGTIHFRNVSHLNRESMQELSLAEAEVRYQGNLLDGMQRLLFSDPLDHRHQIDIHAQQVRYTKPNSVVGSFRSDSAALSLAFAAGDGSPSQVQNRLELSSITWTPPARVQKKYGFFIQGFGYELNAIPVERLGLLVHPAGPRQLQVTEGTVETELCVVRFEGAVRTEAGWTTPRLAPLRVEVTDLSPELQNVLNNVEQLLGITLPKQQNQISFRLVGPLTNPRITHRSRADTPE